MESRQYFVDQNTGISYAIVPEVNVYNPLSCLFTFDQIFFSSPEHLILYKLWLRWAVSWLIRMSIFRYFLSFSIYCKQFLSHCQVTSDEVSTIASQPRHTILAQRIVESQARSARPGLEAVRPEVSQPPQDKPARRRGSGAAQVRLSVSSFYFNSSCRLYAMI